MNQVNYPEQPDGTDDRVSHGEVLSNRYLIMDVLGSGGMGSVYRARDMHFPKVEKIVAVKELIHSSSDLLIRDEVVKIFEREANILATLHHPAIPKIFDFFTDENRIFLVLEFIKGSDLNTILNEYEGFLPIKLVVSWALEICDVLVYLHQQDTPVIFRDLKPSNIMVNEANHIMLVDFGIAKALQASQKGTVIGTEGYSPPEQYRGEATPAVDIYALGATLHYILTRRDPQMEPPFTFHERNIREINPNVPADLSELVQKSLSYEPEKRFQSILEMRSAIENCAKNNNLLIAQDAAGLSISLQNAPRLKWQYQCSDEIRGTATIYGDTVYFGSYDQNLYALDARTGSELWKYRTLGGIVGQPIIWDSVVYIGSGDGRLFAISCRSGKLLWTYDADAPIWSSPKYSEGHVFIGADDGYLSAVNIVTSRAIWKTNLGGAIRSSPAIWRDGLIVGTEAGELCCLDFSGKIRWKFHSRKAITSSPLIYQDQVFFTSLDGYFYCISVQSGWQQWSLRMGKGSVSSPFLAKDIVVFGSADGVVYGVDPITGKPIWTHNTGSQVSGSPAGDQTLVYLGNAAGHFLAMNLTDGTPAWDFQVQGGITSASVLFEDMVMFGSLDQHFYAISGAEKNEVRW